MAARPADSNSPSVRKSDHSLVSGKSLQGLSRLQRCGGVPRNNSRMEFKQSGVAIEVAWSSSIARRFDDSMSSRARSTSPNCQR